MVTLRPTKRTVQLPVDTKVKKAKFPRNSGRITGFCFEQKQKPQKLVGTDIFASSCLLAFLKPIMQHLVNSFLTKLVKANFQPDL